MKTYRRHLLFSRALLALAAAFLGLAGASSLHAQILLNGSFEDPALMNGGFDTGSGGANWTATSGATVYTNGNVNGTTPYGNQWEFLYIYNNVAQTLTGPVTLGRTYTLSLVAADVYGYPGDQLTLSVAGAATASQMFAIPANLHTSGALPFETYSLAFTPTVTGSVTVTLANTSTFVFNYNNSLALDNVQLIVPEPSIWALLGLGGAGLVALTLRRRVRAA